MDPQSDHSSASLPRLACRILLVEDDRDHQLLLSRRLRKAGAEVVVAENGREAIDLACAARDDGRPFDMIIMDVEMPVLDGFDATKALRRAGFANPIIALTARFAPTDRKECLAAGCDDFLAKPFSLANLVRMLAVHLKRFQA